MTDPASIARRTGACLLMISLSACADVAQSDDKVDESYADARFAYEEIRLGLSVDLQKIDAAADPGVAAGALREVSDDTRSLLKSVDEGCADIQRTNKARIGSLRRAKNEKGYAHTEKAIGDLLAYQATFESECSVLRIRISNAHEALVDGAPPGDTGKIDAVRSRLKEASTQVLRVGEAAKALADYDADAVARGASK